MTGNFTHGEFLDHPAGAGHSHVTVGDFHQQVSHRVKQDAVHLALIPVTLALVLVWGYRATRAGWGVGLGYVALYDVLYGGQVHLVLRELNSGKYTVNARMYFK